MRPHPWLVVVLVGAFIGLVFAGVSTYDFVQHLDRQVHSIHCSFIPGGGQQAGESGCQVAMMSPYSSVLRTQVWGGIPISLPAMAVFAFIAFFSIDLLLTRRKDDPRATGFLALATALPAVTSIVMLVISVTKLGTTCTNCVMIYAASALCVVGGIALWRRAVALHATGEAIPRAVAKRSPAKPQPDEPAWTGAAKEPEPAADEPPPAQRLHLEVDAPTTSNQFLAGAFAIGVLFVIVPVLLYLAMAPDHGRFIGTCDALVKPDDTYGVMVRVDRSPPGGAPAIEILDPLCPACRAFEQRLDASGMAGDLDRKAILFPLDNTCNWMVTEATHPGACTVSEAVLCAGERSPEVIAWAFTEQERIRTAAKTDPTAAEKIVEQRFPELAACVGSPEAKSRLNKSLRWAVANNIRVLTPQLFVGNVKLCDEDVDLGLEYSLRVMLDRHADRTLVAEPLGAPPATAKPVEPPPATGSAAPTETPPPTASTPPASGTPSGTPASGTPTATPPDTTGTTATPPPSTTTPPPPATPDTTKPADSAPAKPADSAPDTPPDKPTDKPTDKPADPKPPEDKPVTSPSGTEPPAGDTGGTP